MSKKNKKPPTFFESSGKKKIVLNNVNASKKVFLSKDNNNALFQWSFNSKFIDYKSINFSFDRNKGVDISAFDRKIKEKHPNTTWLQFLKIQNTSNGVMAYHKLDKKAQDCINAYYERRQKSDIEDFREQADEFYKFEMAGKHRLWGIRKDDVLYFIWNDPEHRFYPTYIKNT